MRTRLLSLWIVVAPLMVLPVADKSAEILTLTRGDDGKSFSLSPGDKVEIELASAAGTGFSWVCTQQPPSSLRIEGVRMAEAARMPGGQQMHIHTFSADSAGKVQITCNLVRSWERDAAPAQTFQVEIKVDAP